MLNALLSLVELHREDRQERSYAPWRDDPRPISGLLQGCYSFVGVADFWRTHRLTAEPSAAPSAHFEFALRHEQVRRALRTLSDSDLLTEPGQRFVAELNTMVDQWWADVATVPAAIAALARRASADHYATWRIRHLRPDPGYVLGLADAWLHKEKPRPGRPRDAELRPDTASPTEPRTRTHLSQLRLADPGRFGRIRTNRADVGTHVPGATEADLLLVAGEATAAAAAYRARIRTAPAEASNWVGLGLALAEQGRPVGAALLARPELVRAIHLRLVEITGAAPEPETLATWLDSDT
jgi:hypothetical protein